MGVRLMVADDHLAVRAGITSCMLGTNIEVVCQSESLEQTVRLALTCQPDVLLLDARLGDDDGLAALETIKRKNPAIPVLIFSASEEVKEMALAKKLGAAGFLQKGVNREGLLSTIQRVASGKSAWSARQMRQVVCRSSSEALERNDRGVLSPREVGVLSEIVNGLSNDAIAEKLDVDIETVKQHVKHILKKLYVEDRTQAALMAIRKGLCGDLLKVR